jgi:hypothetical protein
LINTVYMIPVNITEEINTPGQAVSFGSTNSKKMPRIGRAFAVKAEGGNGIVSFMVPKQIFEPHVANLNESKHISLNVTYPPTHKSYQFKGECLNWKAAGQEELSTSEKNLEAFYQILIQWYGPDAAAHIMKYKTADVVHVQMKVSEIFDQTPGPEAGKKIFPSN